MRLNEKNVASFAVCSSPVDREGYLQKKGDLNRDFQRRWFLLKGNLLFYFQKKQDREPQGVIVLEACSVQVSTHGRYCFEISFDGAGTRTYVLGADNDDDMQAWMKAISHASYEYLKSIVDELQRRVNALSSSSLTRPEPSKTNMPGIGTSIPSRSKSTTVKGTSITIQELCNPIAPQEARSQPPGGTKIKKGILVDVDKEEEAPPIPIKKKLVPTRRASGDGGLTDSNDDTNQVTGKLPPPLPTSYSSPLVPSAPIKNASKPYSPPSTLDRTPILQPYDASPSPVHSPHTNTTNTTDMATLTIEDSSLLHQNGMEGAVKIRPTEPSSHPPQASRKLAAPLDPSKSFIEMHEDFTQAMKALNAQRTGTNHTPP